MSATTLEAVLPAPLALADHAPAAAMRSEADELSAILFDPEWYLLEYPDVAWSGVDPILHYFSSGAAEGRNPNALFNTRRYLLSHPDVQASGMNPFMHFMLYGFREGRRAR